jgi:hypothetical protein
VANKRYLARYRAELKTRVLLKRLGYETIR